MWSSTLNAVSVNFIEQNVIPYYGGLTGSQRSIGGTGFSSQFITMIYQLTNSILNNSPILLDYQRDKEAAYNCFLSIAWSNQLKIGMDKEYVDNMKRKKVNPDLKMERFLLDNFYSINEEIECLQPDIVIFMTGYQYDECIKDAVLQQLDRRINKNEIAKLKGIYKYGIVIRTPHPQKIEGYGSNTKDSIPLSYTEQIRRQQWKKLSKKLSKTIK